MTQIEETLRLIEHLMQVDLMLTEVLDLVLKIKEEQDLKLQKPQDKEALRLEKLVD